jgi:hypothetical protein
VQAAKRLAAPTARIKAMRLVFFDMMISFLNR